MLTAGRTRLILSLTLSEFYPESFWIVPGFRPAAKLPPSLKYSPPRPFSSFPPSILFSYHKMSTGPIHLHTESIVPPRYSTDFPRPVAATLEKQAGDDDATPLRGNEPHLASALSLDLPTPAADFPHSDYRYKPTFEIDQNHNVIRCALSRFPSLFTRAR